MATLTIIFTNHDPYNGADTETFKRLNVESVTDDVALSVISEYFEDDYELSDFVIDRKDPMNVTFQSEDGDGQSFSFVGVIAR